LAGIRIKELTNENQEHAMSIARRLRLIAAALALSTCAAAVAEAQTRVRVTSGRPLIIQKQRSFLDSGPVVPQRSLQNYVSATTVLFVPAYSAMGPSGFGAQALPQRFDVPGRPSPLFTF
jgi:hypothetical protein